MEELSRLTIQALSKGDKHSVIIQLKKIHHLISASNEALSFSAELEESLLKCLYLKNKSKQQEKCACMKVVLEMLPQNSGRMKLECLPWDDTQLPYLLPIFLTQATCDAALQNEVLTQIVRWLSTPGYASQVQSICLAALLAMVHQHRTLISIDHVNVVNSQLSEWLKNAELRQAPNPFARSFFKKDTDQLPPVTEIDGSPSRDFFTVLCVGQYFTPKQLLNIHSFSLLRQWLSYTCPKRAIPAAQLQADELPSMTTPKKSSETEEDKGVESGEEDERSVLKTPEALSEASSPSQAGSVVNESLLDVSSTSVKGYDPSSWQSPQGGSGNAKDGSSRSSPAGGSGGSSSRYSPLPSLSGFTSPQQQQPRPSVSISGRSSPSGWSMTSGRSQWGAGPESLSSMPTGGGVTETAFHYSVRVLQQAERKAKVAYDQQIQHAAIYEAVGSLDELCLSTVSLVPRATQAIQKLSKRLSHKHARLLLPVMQFMLNHSEHLSSYDPFPLYEMFLDQSLQHSYSHPAVARDTVQFLLHNLDKLCYKTTLLFRFFPNFFKILAWDPYTMKDDFCELLPAFLSPTTAVEVVHSLLDLPCLTAALELQVRAARHPNNPEGSRTMEAYCSAECQPLFRYILRAEAGFGDTVNRLERVHAVLANMGTKNPRIKACAEIVPELLKVYFDEVLEEGDQMLAAKLVPVLLERSSLLIDVPNYKDTVKKLFCKQLVALFKRYPSLVVEEFPNLLEFVSSTRNIQNREDFFTHVIWAIGEYLSPQYEGRCTPERVSTMYEALETLCYEVTGRHIEKLTVPPRLISVLMSTIAKLCSRSQDLIPRAILCLTKLGQTDREGNVLATRSTHLINLLKMPNIATIILSPDQGIINGRSHRDSSSMPVLLRSTAQLLSSTGT